MTMLIENLYKEQIRRPINAAVAVANRSEETVRAEIDEYVFTPDLIEKFYRFLNTLVSKRTGKTGIWINGYYGSGKSHFIKYIHYCLNETHRDKAFDRLLVRPGVITTQWHPDGRRK